ncbi:hypothetical protein CPZ25_017100 [Eubacterium maltosivorans]|uniref:Uncharacterized protein n=1 Tax=Eubacterium maltosivorans TaxID=2041044 RepID=A0A4P9CDK9_EUBML|nr:hypothetical protein CPZ25_017100 [Eubacterium maltosivorans]
MKRYVLKMLKKRRSPRLAFYPDKKKSQALRQTARNRATFKGNAGHWRDQTPALLKKIQV